jgi:hypothetical protein
MRQGLSQPARRVYRRGRGELTGQQAVISLQTILGHPLGVGGRSALELQGDAHFLPHEGRQIFLHGPKRPPGWVVSGVLYKRVIRVGLRGEGSSLRCAPSAGYPDDLTVLPCCQWNWPLTVSCPERAVLELLDELPGRESFAEADVLVEGPGNLRPALLTKLLARRRKVKVKRLFFFFADRHRHAWRTRIDRGAVDLGKGKRLLVRGGVLDPAYQITVPRELHGVS